MVLSPFTTILFRLLHGLIGFVNLERRVLLLNRLPRRRVNRAFRRRRPCRRLHRVNRPCLLHRVLDQVLREVKESGGSVLDALVMAAFLTKCY